MESAISRVRAIKLGWLVPAALGLAIILTPFFTSSIYYQSIGVFVALYAIAALAMGTLLAYAGRVSMGHGAFYGMGAYTAGILSVRYDVNPWLALLAGGVAAAALAYVLGRSFLGLIGHVFPMSTFALNLVFYVLLVQVDGITGGLSGFGPIPRLAIGGFIFRTETRMYYLAWGVVAIMFLVFWNIGHSRIGRGLRAAHQYQGGSREAAETSGVSVAKYMNQIFALGAFFTGIGGGLYAFYITHLSPSPFSFFFSFVLLMMVIVGGWTSMWGIVLGVMIMIGLKEALANFLGQFTVGGGGSYEGVVFGALFVLVLLFLPGGVVSLPARLRALAWKLRGAPVRREEAVRLGALAGINPSPDGALQEKT